MKKLLLVILVFIGTSFSIVNAQKCSKRGLKINLNTADTVYHCINVPYNSANVTVIDSFTDQFQVTKSYGSGGPVDSRFYGTYREIYIATNLNGDTVRCDRVVIVVDCSVDINLIENSKLSYYPNPTKNGLVNIQVGKPDLILSFELFSMDGKSIYFKSEIEEENTIILPVPGLYFLKISNQNNHHGLIKLLWVD